MIRFRRIFVMFMLTSMFVVSGCVNPVEGEEVAKGLFMAVQTKDFERATSYYSAEFFQKTPKGDWVRNFAAVYEKAGDLQSWKLVSWHVTEFDGTIGKTTNYDLVYEVTYAKRKAKESLSIVKRGGSGPLIVGHQIELLPLSQSINAAP